MLAYTRYTPDSGLLAAHNLDPCRARRVTCRLDDLEGLAWRPVEGETLFDTYPFFFEKERSGGAVVEGGAVSVSLGPLQSLLFRLRGGCRSTGV
ncbi:MAG: hypothetical protein EXS64_00880 [Candidatus Latescibacteria bacterium]|nr:hypothetical protein [Candidatus Latescibacterota bacterium]